MTRAVSCVLFLSLTGPLFGRVPVQITPPAAGPYQVRANRIVDAAGREYLIRGTRLPPFQLHPSAPWGFGPFSRTTLVTVRQRLNMNAVRVAIRGAEYAADAQYRAGVRQLVRQANQFQLVAILEVDGAAKLVGADFNGEPNLFFGVPDRAMLGELRAAGARQPVILAAGADESQDSNVIYEVRPSYTSIVADRAQVGLLAARFPVIVDGLDPQVESGGAECQAFPGDPSKASALVGGLLDFFDEQRVSWTISAIEPGKMIDFYAGYDWSKLDDGWKCGEAPARGGIGMVVLSQLWHADPHGVLTVNSPAGGMVVARGANASAYGRILAESEMAAKGHPLPVKLGNISIRVTDSHGIARLAPLTWTGGGWASTNFVIPAESAAGPAEVAVVRGDGSSTASEIVIGNVAPGLWTATYDGRGPVIAQVSQRFSDGTTAQFPAWACGKEGCHTAPIPLSARAETTLRLEGTGFRFASSKDAIAVLVDGIRVAVESFGPMAAEGRDVVAVKLPGELIGRGEVDVYLVVDGAISNVVRLDCGGRI